MPKCQWLKLSELQIFDETAGQQMAEKHAASLLSPDAALVTALPSLRTQSRLSALIALCHLTGRLSIDFMIGRGSL